MLVNRKNTTDGTIFGNGTVLFHHNEAKLAATPALVGDVGVLGEADLLAELAAVAHIEMPAVGALNVIAHRVRLSARLPADAAGVVGPDVFLNVPLQGVWNTEGEKKYQEVKF